MIVPREGDVILVRDWVGDVITIKVRRVIQSPQYGACVDGYELDESMVHAYRHVTLPVDRIVLPAILTRIGRGKWLMKLPDGQERTFKSKKAGLEFARGLNLEVRVVE